MLNVFDIVGPIMIGPSSSHTAGAVRIGKYARSVLGAEPIKAVIKLSGSFGKTYKGHGTDKALIAGILGMDTDDDRIRNSMDIAAEQNLDYIFIEEDIDDTHPNTAEITLFDVAGNSVVVRGASIGGGNIIIDSINGAEVSISGKSDTLVITHDDIPGMIAIVSNVLAHNDVNIHGFSLARDRKGGTAIMTIEIDGSIDDNLNNLIMGYKGIHASMILKAI